MNTNVILLSSRFTLYLVVTIIFGVITTIYNYKGFGIGNHIEQLPLILRSFDSNYLGNDFFVNEGVKSIARHYFLTFITKLAGTEQNLPFLFLALTFISNISISVITYFTANKLFNKSNIVGLVASALVMSISTFSLGRGGVLFQSMLLPSTVVYPLILAAIFLVLNDKLLYGIIICGLSSILHPLIGLEVGVILLATYIIFQLFCKPKSAEGQHKEVIYSIIIFSFFTLISIVPQFNQPAIDTNFYSYILAHFRHPHHYVPSSFSIYGYIAFFLFLSSAMFVLLLQRKQTYRNKDMSFKIGILLLIINCLFLGGYFFVEVIPINLWVKAQTFRLTYILQWLGIIVITGFLLEKPTTYSSKLTFLFSTFEVAALFIFLMFYFIKNKLKLDSFERILTPFFNLVVILILIILIVYVSNISIKVLSFYLIIILSLESIPDKHLSLGGGLSVFFVILIISFSDFILPKEWNIAPIKQMLDRAYNIKPEVGDKGSEIVDYVKENTPTNAIFLTPHNWGQFRILARRAIVVDLKAFPFSNKATLEWYNRVQDCYGESNNSAQNITALLKGISYEELGNEMRENYTKIDDQTIKYLTQKYHMSYAILFDETPTKMKILFNNDKFKVICLHPECE